MSCRVLCKTGRVYLKESFPFPFPLSLFSSSSTTTMYSTFPTSIVVMSPPPLSLLCNQQKTQKNFEQPNSNLLFLLSFYKRNKKKGRKEDGKGNAGFQTCKYVKENQDRKTRKKALRSVM